MDDISNYEKLREDAHNFYRKIGAIRCPAFNNELIYFTAEGFNHLIYKGNRKERDKNVQIMKFKLLQKAKVVIEISTTYQEYDESLISIRKRRFKRVVEETVIVRYWGIVAIIQNSRVKIIVRQMGNGQKHFLSVIPAWKTSQYRDVKLVLKAKRDLMDD